MPRKDPKDSASVREAKFKLWYGEQAKRHNLDPNPDDPRHFYDYRKAYEAGAIPNSSGHWPSKYKLQGHPRLVIKGVDTRYGDPK